ncbi:MAG: glutamine--fructose-6-phosphate transaminase (isomerizing) [Melioribacteraceae bacterium]|nr:glutamine--fructose-6-phosphate transaminase (isomerizing) [Melioribacteraceae bacterium]MCF8354847.1 glutamine--fructose-6-phosphate transaminase (isomerizing) [Melioribacteraceae bacterium]MCF8392954.1 glutamine--fructose-6-phosphate transaminase (isomerizing) [Melioribacteraceae bacterium]MCF8417303.1 glutamine--fructose-6-phosphate transaminase (isomerizing) [Melioribacteraceae bacterium]
MCGIVGYIGNKNCVPMLIEGLKQLEYRGYDSAGVGILTDDKCEVVKAKGKVSILDEKVNNLKLSSTIGIGHTRWATHGIPNEINAHPHLNMDKTLFIIHNGIIENYAILKKQLIEKGYRFVSDTDTEVISNLIDRYLKQGNQLFQAVRYALNKVEGTYGIAVIYQNEPDKIIVAKKGSPLVIGVGENENFIASDVNALIAYTKRVVYMEDDEIAVVTKEGFNVKSIHDEQIDKAVIDVDMDIDEITKGGYAHFMLKEIMEQPESLRNSMRGRTLVEEGFAKLGGLIGFEERLSQSKRIIISACGTSWHAGMVGEYMLEQYTGIPVEVEYASEFRYRNPIIHHDDSIIFISQSGETADTLAAMKESKRRGPLALGVCNVVGSSIARESDAGVYIHAGPEIGVASTKAFTSQLVVLSLITLLIARKKTLSQVDGSNIIRELNSIPEKVDKILQLNDEIEAIAEKFVDATNFLYLGRGYNFPVALEGALKLKEISYIHAEGYPAAEMKHGPIALIDENMPVVFIAPKDSVYDKVISNIEEVKARGGRIIAVATENDNNIDSMVDYTIKIPNTIRMLMPILTVIPLQLLAYHIAVKKGLDVDQPRNLAKSVTVE